MASASSGLSEFRASRYLEYILVSRELHWPGEKRAAAPTIVQILVDQPLTHRVGEAERVQHHVDVVAVADFALNDLLLHRIPRTLPSSRNPSEHSESSPHRPPD